MPHGRTIEEAQSVQGPLGEGSELVGSRDLSRVAGILVAIAQRLVNGESRMAMVTTVAYVRVSTEDQVEFSPDAQVKRCRDLARLRDLGPVTVLADEGWSGRNSNDLRCANCFDWSSLVRSNTS